MRKLILPSLLLALLLLCSSCGSSRWSGAYIQRGSGNMLTLYFGGDFCPQRANYNNSTWDLIPGTCQPIS
jgi:hypothetical protein